MLAGEATRALLIGISKYKTPSLDLHYAAANAIQLRAALNSPAGCGIPDANLCLLLDHEATASALTEALGSCCSAAEKEDILIFYFSGHGERVGDRFYLVPSDANPRDLSESAVDMQAIQASLATCLARGILVILDCCLSAGFAEHADALFRSISGRDFLLLLCASRAGQASVEFDRRQGTLFTGALLDVLESRANIGAEAGVIYFSELFGFVQSYVAEGLELLGQPPSVQEPVFAGTYSRDPRLFILNRLSLERVEAQTPR
jgi:metacaspase-1